MSEHTAENDAGSQEWSGAVVRSGIDTRVWVAVLPDEDTSTGAMQASTSLRRCKAHVERGIARWTDAPVRWERSDDGWDSYVIPPGSGDHA